MLQLATTNRKVRMLLDPELMFEMSDGYSPPDISDFLPVDAPTSKKAQQKDLFAERKFAAWKQGNRQDLARCDFEPNKAALIRKYDIRLHTLWRRSLYGATLVDIKQNSEMPGFIAKNMAEFITQCIGEFLDPEQFAIIIPPKRRHKIGNFAEACAAKIAGFIEIPFIPDVAECHSRQRTNAEFHFNVRPDRKNLIVFDDIITTGSTMLSMKNLLHSEKFNAIYFAAILNK